jgi:hypothetical protein
VAALYTCFDLFDHEVEEAPSSSKTPLEGLLLGKNLSVCCSVVIEQGYASCKQSQPPEQALRPQEVVKGVPLRAALGKGAL